MIHLHLHVRYQLHQHQLSLAESVGVFVFWFSHSPELSRNSYSYRVCPCLGCLHLSMYRGLSACLAVVQQGHLSQSYWNSEAEKLSGDPGLQGFKQWQVLLSSDKLPRRAAMRDKGKYIIKSELFSSLKSCFTWHLVFLLCELKQVKFIYSFEVLLLGGRFTTQLLHEQHKQQLSSPASYIRFTCSETLLVCFKNKCLHVKSEDL